MDRDHPWAENLKDGQIAGTENFDVKLGSPSVCVLGGCPANTGVERAVGASRAGGQTCTLLFSRSSLCENFVAGVLRAEIARPL